MRPPGEIKVLVVEDDPFFQRVLQKRIAIDGYQVMTASDGREGMKAIVTFEPDLVISDWMMPQVDGLELCQSVKTGLRESAPYFILLTAKGEINDRLLGLETGADDYLVKPCDQGELMARVRAGLRIVVLTQELRHSVNDLKQAKAEVEAGQAELSRLTDQLPICSSCKRVRVGGGEWQDLEHYLRTRLQADHERAVCPDCREARESRDRPKAA
ncbi:MAG: response regulator transcription factor [Candidatus Eiseniibacteriota bacterium]